MAGSRTIFLLILLVATVGIGPARADLGIGNHAPDIAGLSGERGDRVESPKEVSRGKAGIGLTIFYRGDVACGAALEGRKVGANANFETLKLSRCSTGKGRSDDETIDVGYDEHVTGFQVCVSSDDTMHIAGLEVESAEFDEDGKAARSGGIDRFSGPGCDSWGGWSSCEENYVVTGFVAHFNRKERGHAGPDALVGLQAVCREVIKK